MPDSNHSGFYVRSSLFALLSLAGAILNYALYPSLAHLLSVADFGNFTVVIALSNQLLAILLAFNVISVALVKNYDEETAHDMAQAIQKRLIRLFTAVSILVLISSPLIRSHLHVEEPMLFFALTILLLINVPVVIWSGYLQGNKRLINVGLYTFSSSLAKLLLAVLLGWALGALGATWGVVLGILVGMAILKLSSDIKLPSVSASLKKLSANEAAFVKNYRRQIIQALLVVGGLGFLQNIDIIYAKAFFSPQIGGVYSGISILSNAIYYVAFLLIWIVLPEIDPKQPKDNRRVLTTAYRLLGLMAAGAIALEVIARDHLTNTLLGPDFTGQRPALIYATLFQISLVATSLYAYYLLVIRSTRSAWLGLSVIVPCLVVPFFFRDSPQSVVISLWLSVLIGVGIYCIINMLFKSRREDEKQVTQN